MGCRARKLGPAAALICLVSVEAAVAEEPPWGNHKLGETYAPQEFHGCTRKFETLPSRRLHPHSIRKKIVAHCRKKSGRTSARYYFVGDRQAVEKSRLYAIEIFFTDDAEGHRARSYENMLRESGGRVQYGRRRGNNRCTLLVFGSKSEGVQEIALIRFFRHPDRYKNYGRAALALMSHPPDREHPGDYTHFVGLCERAVSLEWDDVPG